MAAARSPPASRSCLRLVRASPGLSCDQGHIRVRDLQRRLCLLGRLPGERPLGLISRYLIASLAVGVHYGHRGIGYDDLPIGQAHHHLDDILQLFDIDAHVLEHALHLLGAHAAPSAQTS